MKRYQWVAVSVSFVLAVTLWLLVTLNKQSYTTTFTVPLKLTNFPENLQLLSEFPQEMDVFTTGPGIKLFYQGLDPVKDTIKIDFEQFRDRGFFTAGKNLKLISDALQPGLSAVAGDPDTISLSFAVKSNKKIPVRLDLEWDLPPSYRVLPREMRFTDSVLVVGPTDLLAKISECKTVHFKLPNSVAPQFLIIPLDSLSPLQLLPNSIKLSYTPLPYTEKVLRLPIKVVGLPMDTEVHLDPDTLELKLLLPLERFESVTKGSIGAEVNFKTLNERSNMVVPSIVNVPADAELVSFSPNLLRYIMITKQ
ncbi:MAG: hypothetical protein RLZZ519_1698 [Bacteroidota bacterium]|jgi:hypothetical protein